MIHVITGPPCSGKTTYAREHAKEGELIIDYDAIVQALGGKAYEAAGDIRDAAIEARKAAIQVAKSAGSDAWIIDTEHDEKFLEDEELIELDPGRDVCLERAKQDGRPQSTFDGIEKWYSGRKGRKMEHLYKSFEIKADAETGAITGYFSTYDREPDSYGDVIAPGAFEETIKARKESGHPFPLCWNHDLDQIIGAVDHDNIKDTEKGPLMTATFFDTPLAQEKREIVKSGVVYQFSFAYDVLEAGPVELEDGVKANELRKLDLFEISIVPIPANQNAVMTEVKADAPEEKTAPVVGIIKVEVPEELKSGRRNSKKDADAIREAITLLQGVLGELEDTDDPEDGKDKAKANGAPEEPKQSNPEKERLLEYINNMKTED